MNMNMNKNRNTSSSHQQQQQQQQHQQYPPSSQQQQQQQQQHEPIDYISAEFGTTTPVHQRGFIFSSTTTPSTNKPSSNRNDSILYHNNNINNDGVVDSSVSASASAPSSGVQFWEEIKSLARDLIEYARLKTWKKKLLTVLLCVCSLMVFYDLFFGHFIVDWLQYFILWMTDHYLSAVLAFISVFVLSTLAFVPPAILIFGAGYAFAQAIGTFHGILAAFFSSFLGSCIGAVIAFLRSRYMMRDLIYVFAKRYPLVRAADRALKRNGFHVMLLLRLCPLIPFNGLNYCCGITGVKMHDFAMALVGIIPFQLFTVCVGATAGTLAMNTSPITNNNNDNDNDDDDDDAYQHQDLEHYSTGQQIGWVILLCSGIACGILAFVYTWTVVKTELQKELELTPEEFETFLHPAAVTSSSDAGEGRPPHHNQDGMEQGIEANYMPPSLDEEEQEEAEEWFWVWA